MQHACWFYSTKRLANASRVQLSSDSQAIYKVISNFRKEQSRLDGCVAIAAMLIQKNISIRDLHAKIIINLKILNIVSKYRKYIPAIILSILTFISNEINLLPRQLKDEAKNASFIEECIKRYKKNNPSAIIAKDKETLETIIRWIKARNPYQSELLEYACHTADQLKELQSKEFKGNWSLLPKEFITHTTTSMVDSNSNIDELSVSRPEVIVLRNPQMESHATAQLSVAEKQVKRELFLAEFNRKINSETLNVFNMSALKFQTAFELFEVLKQHGPIIMQGYYGKSFYHSSAQELKDANGCLQYLGSRKILGWHSSEVKTSSQLNLKENHQIIIIGMKLNEADPKRSQVIFLDPSDESVPNEERKAYRMSFERLCINRMLGNNKEFIGYYSNACNYSEDLFKKEVIGKNSMFKYGLLASLGLGAFLLAKNNAIKDMFTKPLNLFKAL